jgi:hypothetical protein
LLAYSPKCLEVVFSEGRLYRVLGGSHAEGFSKVRHAPTNYAELLLDTRGRKRFSLRFRIGIGPNNVRYHEAIEELEYEGAIEWATSARYARGNKHYVITQRGLDDAGWGSRGERSKGFPRRKQSGGDRVKEATRDGARSC